MLLVTAGIVYDQAFARQVSAHRGKTIEPATADEWVSEAAEIIERPSEQP